ncbi:MAG TPA: MMPL family transporter [Terriglobales bacterium]|nr:MMPL family transporter [Terriglobales bacterium]
MFDRLGRLVIRLRFVFVAGWVAAAVIMGALAPSLSQAGSADETSFLPRDAESLAARHVIATAFPADSAPTSALVVFSRAGGLTDGDRAAIEGLRRYFEGSGHPAAVQGYVTAEGSPSLASMLRSPDGVVELARIDMSTPSFLPVTNAAIDAIREHFAKPGVVPAGLIAQVTGQAGIGHDYLAAIEEGTNRTTLVTIILVVLVLLLIYRAPLAALAPLITIGSAFLIARGVLGFMAQAGWQLSSVLDSFIVVLVFGVGTDYTIFLISRFREELGRHNSDAAVQVTVSRIGAVITASAATVIVGLASMVAARFGMIQTTGPALAIVIFVTLLAGLTLTPSLLAIFGRRIFWPVHEKTRTAADEERGFWAALARRITARPGLLAVAVLALLLVPVLALPQLKENFDVLNELPAGAESREGYDTLSRHLAEGQLMPLTVLVQSADGSKTDFTSSQGLAGTETLGRSIAALPNVQTVRSIVDPLGEGKVSDLLRPSIQLPEAAAAFRKPPGTDLNVQLSDASLAGIQSTAGYVGGLGTPDLSLSSGILPAANADLATLVAGLTDARKQALVTNQLDAIAAQLRAAAAAAAAAGASGGSGGQAAADAAAQLAALKSYLDELGAARTAVKSEASYGSAQNAVAALTVRVDPISYAQLLASIQELSAWFTAQPAPFYFAPTAVAPSAATLAAQQAMAAARLRLPGELDALAAAFTASDLYAPPDLRAAYVSADGTVARLYVTTATNPYDTKSFETVRELRSLMATDPGGFGAAGAAGATGAASQAYVGGATAEFADVQDTISADFLRVAAITIIGILIVLILLLRAIVAPVYLVLTVLLSYATSLSLAALILQRLFGQAGVNYFIPLMVFVLLVALGSDYNIFLMSRVREESSTRELRPGIRVASARTGTVITSAGLILAGTFGALVTSPLQLLFQVGLAVALGVLIDTFIVRSLLVPALTAFIGERAWWPFHRRRTE